MCELCNMVASCLAMKKIFESIIIALYNNVRRKLKITIAVPFSTMLAIKLSCNVIKHQNDKRS